MHRSLLLPIGALAGALALGCADQPTPSEPAGASRPSFRTEQNPEGPGAFVVIVPEASFVVFETEPAPGITAIVGTTFAEHLQFCATGEPPFPVRRLLVFRPDGSVMTTVHGQQLPILVWQTGLPGIDILAEICGEALLETPHLEGTAQFTAHDNDVFTTGNRANAGGFQINAHVSSETGERFIFAGKFHGVINKTHNKCCSFDLELKPIGQ
jgi:hypothetical protein